MDQVGRIRVSDRSDAVALSSEEALPLRHSYGSNRRVRHRFLRCEPLNPRSPTARVWGETRPRSHPTMQPASASRPLDEIRSHHAVTGADDQFNLALHLVCAENRTLCSSRMERLSGQLPATIYENREITCGNS